MSGGRSSTARCFLAVLAVYALFLVLQFFPPQIPQVQKYLPAGVFLHLCIAVLACVVCLISGGTLRRDLMLRAFRARHVPAALLLWIAATVLMELLLLLLLRFFPQNVVSTDVLTAPMARGGFWYAVLFTALVPAVCEELLFRGYMLSTLRRAFGILPSCLISAALFAVAHVSPWRMAPMLLLGFFLGLAGCFSGSVFIPVLMHFLNNLSVVLESYYPKTFAPARELVFGHGIWVSLAIAVVCAAGGVLLLRGGVRPRR